MGAVSLLILTVTSVLSVPSLLLTFKVIFFFFRVFFSRAFPCFHLMATTAGVVADIKMCDNQPDRSIERLLASLRSYVLPSAKTTHTWRTEEGTILLSSLVAWVDGKGGAGSVPSHSFFARRTPPLFMKQTFN